MKVRRSVLYFYLFFLTNTHIKGSEKDILIQKHTINYQTSLKNHDNLKKEKKKKRVKQDMLHPKSN